MAGTDDTLRNMRWRLEQICAVHPLAGIAMVVFERLQLPANDNVYSRFRQRHTREHALVVSERIARKLAAAFLSLRLPQYRLRLGVHALNEFFRLQVGLAPAPPLPPR